MPILPHPCPTPSGEAAGVAAAVVGLVNHTIFHRDYPVTGIRRYRRDVQVEKKTGIVPARFTSTKRGEVSEFSFRSRYRLLHMAKNCNADFRSMATLTYPKDFPCDGLLVKKHLDNFKKWLRREVPEVLGLWFLEFQRRGAPHFHFLLSLALEEQGELVVKRRSRIRGHKRDSYVTCGVVESRFSAAWFRIVGSEDEKHLRAGVCLEQLESSDAALCYAAAHASKPHQKSVPESFTNVGRFWGKVGNLRLVGGEYESMDTAKVFEEFGPDALSSKGRVKKYIWDVL